MIKQSFDAGWEFTDQPVGFFSTNIVWQPVTLPHDVSITKPRRREHPTGGAGGYAWSGVVTYRKKFAVPKEWAGGSVQLEFEGVYMNAKVSVNGNVAAFHPYGYTSFFADLTPYLKFGEENEVVVVVNNSAQPNSRWYTGTGIYRHVWLRQGGAARIRPWGVFVTTPVADPATSTVSVATELDGDLSGAALRSTILDADGAVVASVETPVSAAGTVRQSLTVTGAKLWSVDEPNLYTLRSELLSGGAVVDSETTPFGIRKIEVDAEQGFRLNGVPLKLKGGCVHHDNGLLGAASYDRAEERKIELMKASGYNAIRCAHNPPAPAMLDACDRLGMLVIDETFDCWRMGKNPNDYHLYFEDWWQRDTESMVLRDRNHPSIIMWSIGNEVPERTGVSDGYAWARKQAACIRALDNTRWITSALPFLFEEFQANQAQNDGENPPSEEQLQQFFNQMISAPEDPEKDRWGQVTREFNEALDVVGYNYLVPRYAIDGGRFPGRVICGTETWPHQAYDFWKETERLPYVIGDFVWTSLDYLGESGIGKVTVEGEEGGWNRDPWPYHLANCGDIDICGFKRPQSYYRDILWGVRTAPFIAVLDPQLFGKKVSFNQWGWEPVIDSWTFPGQEGQTTRVDVYSDADEVELWLNGERVGRKPAGAAVQNKVSFELAYRPGTLEAVAYTGGQVSGRCSLSTAGEAAALRLTPDRPALRAQYGDLAYVTLEVVDQAGNVVKYGRPVVSFTVEGPVDLLALGAADPLSEELYVGSERKAFEGRLMAVVRASGQPGEIRLKARSEGLAAAEVSIQVM